jgi:hypothetical protein
MKQKFLPAILLAGLFLALAACDKSPPAPSGDNVPATTNIPSATTQPSPELAKLKGRWERPDGGYILEIRAVAADGRVDAGYFNPSPINVARGVAYREGSASRVVIELRDVGYPGSTYQLTLDAASDQLIGQYFQAATGQTYDVVFVRHK